MNKKEFEDFENAKVVDAKRSEHRPEYWSITLEKDGQQFLIMSHEMLVVKEKNED